MKLDNYALVGWQRCPAWYDLRINQGWAPRRKSAALGSGGAIHAALAEWYKSRNVDASMARLTSVWPSEHPVDDWRTLEKAQLTVLQHMKEYTHESFSIVGADVGRPMIEVASALPTGMYLPVCKTCTADNRQTSLWDRFTHKCFNCGADLELLEYGGIFDGLVEFNGAVYVLEHKTTSQLGPLFFHQFKPNNQISGYCWLARELTGGRCDGAIVSAIGYFKAGATRFERQITTRDEVEIDAWLLDLWTEACAIDEHRRSGIWPKRTTACTLYGLCEFHSVHTLSDPAQQQRLLEQDYIHDTWNFENRDD